MTPEKTKEAFDSLRSIASTNECINAKRLSPEEATLNIVKLDSLTIKQHFIFMCEEGKNLVDQGRIEKAMRWLGFLQGSLWAMGYVSLEEMKETNRPKESDYDAKRI